MPKKSKILAIVLALAITFSYAPIFNIPVAYAANLTGIEAYQDAANNIPKYRTWNGTDFSAQSADTVTTVATMQWFVIKEAPGRTERILGTLSSTGALYFQVQNGAGTWSIGTGAPASGLYGNVGTTNDGMRGFDISYEDISTDALIVYEKDTVADSSVYYRTWNGSSWSAEQTLTYTTGSTGAIQWVLLEKKPLTDEIMLVTKNDTADNTPDVRAIVWNGSSWVNEQLLTDTGTVELNRSFDVTYEASSGDALVMYGTGTTLDFWTYVNGVWTDGTGAGVTCTVTAADTVGCINPGAAVHNVELASARSTNHIALIGSDAGTDLWAQVWDGTQWFGIPSAIATWDEAAIQIVITVTNQPMDVAFETAGNRFLFAFIDFAALAIDYFFFDLDDLGWKSTNGTTALTDIDTVTGTGNILEDDGGPLQMAVNPNDTSQIMITVLDLLDDIRSFLWNGSSWTQPTQFIHASAAAAALDFQPFYFTWDLTNARPNQPTNSSPANGATNQSLTPTLSTSAFSDPNGDLHAASQWQVDNNADFSSPEFDSGVDTVNKTSITVSPALTPNTTFYWHVRYQDNSGKPGAWSAYSTAFSFTTTQVPATPTNTSPTNGANVSTLTPTLTSSAYSDPDGDPHAASQWQITTTAGNYTSPVFDSGEDTTNKTSITVSPALNWDVTYYWHVRHKDNKGAWSSYSPETSFNTLNTPPDTPTNTSPTNGATNQLLGPTLIASAFNDPNPGHTHYASQWQVTTVSGNYTSPVFNSGEDTVNKTSIIVSPNLAEGTIHYWHVRYKDNSGASNPWSAYSTETSFTTGIRPNTPSNSLPTNGATNQLLTPILTSSAFSDPNGDGHAASQWQITTVSGNYTSPVFDSGEDATNKTSITVSPALTKNTLYYWHVRHKDNSPASLWSNYSSETSFTTSQGPATPSNSSPANGANVNTLTPTLTSSAFSDPQGNSHSASQWQITTVSGNYTSPVFDSGEDAINKTSITVSPALSWDVTYYWHVRHKNDKGAWSSYSTETSFNTLNIAPSTPTNLLPADGAVLYVNPTLVSSNFSDPNNNSHAASQWQITRTAGDYTAPVYNSGETAVYLTAIKVPIDQLPFGFTYYWHVRHKDNTNSSVVWSAYSVETSFTASEAPINIKIGGQGLYQPGESIELTAQVQDERTFLPINDATVTINIYNPSKTKLVNGAAMSYVSGSNGLYTYTYVAPSTTGTYIFDIKAITSLRAGYNASTFSVSPLAADIANIKEGIIAFTGTADSGTTLTLVDNALTQANDFWNGMTLIITGGTNVGEIRQIADFDAATDKITVDSAFTLAIDNTSTYLIRRDMNWAERVWNYTTRTITSFGTLVADIWAYSSRTLTAFGSLAADVWNGTFAPTRRLTDKTLTGGGSLATEAYIDTATSTITAEFQKQWTVYLSDFGEILAGNTYRTKLWVLNYASIPTDANSTPTVTIYDALRNTVVSGVAMTKISTGIYEHTYSVAAGATQGVWETEASAGVEVGKTIKVSDYWEVEGSPAQVLLNSISDSTVPSIAASVTISNEGSAGFEYQYEWCVVSAENNPCGGGDDVYNASAAKFIQAGQDFNTTLTATVSNTGIYWFKVVVTFGTEKSGASRTFTATTEPAPTPTLTPAPAGGGGGGGGILTQTTQPTPTGLSSGSAFCSTFSAVCDILNAILARLTGVETKTMTLTASMVKLETRMAALERKIFAVPVPAPQIIREQIIIRQPMPAVPTPRAKIRLETTP